MKKGKFKIALMLSLAMGTVLPALAGDAFVYAKEGGAVMVIPAGGNYGSGLSAKPIDFTYSAEAAQQYIDSHATASDREFSFGEALSPTTFANQWANYLVNVPENCTTEYAKPLYDEIFYSQQDAVYDLGAATDLIVVSADTTDEKPDPEEHGDSAYLLMTFFSSMREGERGSNVDTLARSLMGAAAFNTKLSDYAEIDIRTVGGYEYLHYRMDYGKVMQQLYRELYGEKHAEHPAYEEVYYYQLDLYFRRIDDKLMTIYTLAAGEYYGQSDAILSGLRAAHQ